MHTPCFWRRLFGRTRTLLLLLMWEYSFARCEVRRRAAVLFSESVVERLAPSLQVISTPAGPQTARVLVEWRRRVILVGRHVRTRSGRGGGRVQRRRATGYRASKSPLSPPSRAAPSPPPPRCTSQSELHQSSHSKPRIGVKMHDGRADIDEQDIFVHVYFDPAYFHIVFLLCDRLKSAGFLVRH